MVGKELVTGADNFEGIELTASSAPTRTGSSTVLEGTGDLGVEEPHSRHITIRTRGTRSTGHGELEDEDLVSTSESVVSWNTGTVVSTVVSATLVAGEDDDLLVGVKSLVLKDLRTAGTASTVRTGIRNRVTEVHIPNTRSGTTLVVHESDAISGLRRGVIVSNLGPRTCRRASRRRSSAAR
ncbi:hypothetical protein AWJ20_728 [Sugiyamaella lignohabitans]|uniref:Uncharacterized protein n=1 Tax=Sugiyamaella lignohabitans TaxID=796027 RepID=A0A167D4N9_9ASCO|nr:uncharacterized protein AWJ20_728 [Sugiyamaella lignohabitans]ANB12473.1 hypothetical protein AWJ20_728 [Sugiyamaella lignohabitans]